jgi:hypothetical protein
MIYKPFLKRIKMKKQYKYFLFLVVITSFTYAQSNRCYERFVNCKEIVINGFKNNDPNVSNKLTDELVAMQMCDSSLGAKFTAWYQNFATNYKTQINDELMQLQQEKQQVQEQTSQVRTNTSNAIIKQNQKYMEQSKNNAQNNNNVNSKNTNSQEKRTPLGPGEVYFQR